MVRYPFSLWEINFFSDIESKGWNQYNGKKIFTDNVKMFAKNRTKPAEIVFQSNDRKYFPIGSPFH